MTQPRQFDCIDCGTKVYSIGFHADNDQNICAECLWLRNIPDPVERELLRAWLNRDSNQHPSITCPKCGRTSYNPNDIKEKYCGNCHKFHDQL